MTASVQQPSSASFSHPAGAETPRGRSSLETRPASFHGHTHGHTHGHVGHGPSPPNSSAKPFYAAPSPHAVLNGPLPYANGYRSFEGRPSHAPLEFKPQIYTASYSGVSVYEVELNGVAVMRRRSDSWLNATQILKVAGVEKGKRTKVLEKEILTGEHEKVQGGYGKYQGTWINYNRGREFCRQYGVEDILKPLLDYDVSSDGSGAPGNGVDTPTKEQAMAANRKRLYNPSVDGRTGGPSSNGTFFSNISPVASSALAALNKASRLNSPAPRAEGQRRPSTLTRLPSSQAVNQEYQAHGSSQANAISQSAISANGLHVDLGYGSPSASGIRPIYTRDGEMPEPPQKKIRQSSEEQSQPIVDKMDAMIRLGTPTEPNESFIYHPFEQQSLAPGEESASTTIPPLPSPTDKIGEEKQTLLLDLFADKTRTDFGTHSAILHLSGEDLDLPLDQSANTALHWSATLGRISLMRLLIEKGANIFRGNIAGQTPLMAAVQVKNCFDHGCFPELLETLSPLIEIRDAQGRTILHHIAVSCGIKGRAASSKYYLEALLEFLVRGASNASSQQSLFEGGVGAVTGTGAYASKPIGLMKFMSDMVNARDRAGNTALNLVARIGNRNIIQQLLEVQADAHIPNHKGLRPVDFGVGSEADLAHLTTNTNTMLSPEKEKIGSAVSKIEESQRDMVSSVSSLLSQVHTQFASELHAKQERIDLLTRTIRDLSAQQRHELARFDDLQTRLRARTERKQKIANLRRALADQRARNTQPPDSPSLATSSASASTPALQAILAPIDPAQLTTSPHQHQTPSGTSSTQPSDPSNSLAPKQRAYLSQLPSAAELRAHLAAHESNNRDLESRAQALLSRNATLEAQARRVVALCTRVPEERVPEALPGLLAAVESEQSGAVEVARVRDFLRKVEGVGG